MGDHTWYLAPGTKYWYTSRQRTYTRLELWYHSGREFFNILIPVPILYLVYIRYQTSTFCIPRYVITHPWFIRCAFFSSFFRAYIYRTPDYLVHWRRILFSASYSITTTTHRTRITTALGRRTGSRTYLLCGHRSTGCAACRWVQRTTLHASRQKCSCQDKKTWRKIQQIGQTKQLLKGMTRVAVTNVKSCRTTHIQHGDGDTYSV